MKKTMMLCSGRHDIPEAIDGAIFDSIENPTDIDAMKKVVAEKLKDCSVLHLYVTGFTPALGEVIKYCSGRGVFLDLYHYDRNSEKYYRQNVLWYRTCPFCGTGIPEGGWYCPGCGST